mgnify:FL=1|tara:strand:+ start:732 stop:1253 length:522 start_codon:yes stop_codon:yes gene_type:complete
MSEVLLDLVSGKDVIVIGNALSLNEDRLHSLIKSRNVITCAFNKGVERFKPDIAFLNVADHWKKRIDTHDAFTVHVSPFIRPSRTADYTIPLKIVESLRPIVGPRPSSGCIVNSFFSQKSLNIKSVTLIGFDFKLTPTYYDQTRVPANEPHNYEKEKDYALSHFVEKCNFNIV